MDWKFGPPFQKSWIYPCYGSGEIDMIITKNPSYLIYRWNIAIELVVVQMHRSVCVFAGHKTWSGISMTYYDLHHIDDCTYISVEEAVGWFHDKVTLKHLCNKLPFYSRKYYGYQMEKVWCFTWLCSIRRLWVHIITTFLMRWF